MDLSFRMFNDALAQLKGIVEPVERIKFLRKRRDEFLQWHPMGKPEEMLILDRFSNLISEEMEELKYKTKPQKNLESRSKETPATSENPHLRYFKEPVHWQIFNDWQQQNVVEKSKLADYSFIYWVMWEDGFIHKDIGPTGFKEWIKSTYSTKLGKQLKQLAISATPAKYSLYASLIDKYKLNSITLQKRSKNTTKK